MTQQGRIRRYWVGVGNALVVAHRLWVPVLVIALLLTLILFVALAAGIGAAFARGQVQTTFPTQNRLTAVTGLPVLGTLSEVVLPAERARRRQGIVWLGGAGAALAASYAVLVLVEFWQRSALA